jgi:TPR repeat protein
MRRLALVAVLAAFAAFPARAQFYDLDGAYHCVTAPDQACAKAEADTPDTAQQKPKGKEAEEPALFQAIEHVKKRDPTEADMRLLETRAEAKDPRAVEVLAWCKLNGIGTKADAVGAFWLYHDAAQLGVRNAQRNETAIFERRLTSAERQQVLVQESAH